MRKMAIHTGQHRPRTALPNRFNAVTSAAVSVDISARVSSRGSAISGDAVTDDGWAGTTPRGKCPSSCACSADRATTAIALVWS